MSVVGLLNRSPAAALWVDPKVHAADVARFRSKIVTRPGEEDCSIWIGSIGADGYGSSGNVEGNHSSFDLSAWGIRSIDVEQCVEARGQHDVERSSNTDAELGGTPVASECERQWRAAHDGTVEPGIRLFRVRCIQRAYKRVVIESIPTVIDVRSD